MRRILIFSFLILFSINAKAQFGRVKYMPNYDYKFIHWGFSFGVDKYDFIVNQTENFAFADTLDNLYGIVHKWQPGAHLGPVLEVKISKYWRFRTLVTLTFQQRNMIYYFDQGQTQEIISIPSTFIQMPMLLKYNGARNGNSRPYVIFGVSPIYDISATKKVVDDRPRIYLQTTDFSGEVGAGIEWFLPYFKFSTELKFGRGFFNVLEPDNTVYTKYLQSLYSYYMMFSLHFEG